MNSQPVVSPMAVFILLTLFVAVVLVMVGLFANPGRRAAWIVLGVASFALILLVMGLFSVRSTVHVATPATIYQTHGVVQQHVQVPDMRIERQHVDSPVESLRDVQVEAEDLPLVVARSGGGGGAFASARAGELSEWLKQINAQNVAQDPHTSTETLHRFLIERIVSECEKIGPGDSPRRVLGKNVSEELAALLTSELHAETATDANFGKRPPEETWVTLEWQSSSQRKVNWWPEPMVKGTLVARIAGPKGSATVSAKLDEKPWLYQMPDSPRGGEYLVSISGEPQSSPAQALQSARLAATSALYPHVRSQLLAMPQGSRVPDHVLREHVQRMAQSDARVVDQCLVRLDRPYGTVWYAAQLRQASTDVLRSAAVSSINVSTERRQTFAGMVLGLGGMILVLGLVYLGLNALTRGYFRAHLQVATVVLVVVAAAAIFLLMA